MQPVEPRWLEFYEEAKLLAGFESARELYSYAMKFFVRFFSLLAMLS